MSGEVLGGVVIAAEDMEVVTVDLDVSTNSELSWSNEFLVLIDIFVLSSFKEGSFDDTRVLLSWLKDRNGIVSKIEGNDESPVHILWHFCIESGGISENFLVIVHIFEEVDFWLLWNQIIYVSERVDFVTESVVRWDLNDNSLSGLWLLNLSNWEVSVVLSEVVILCELVDTLDGEGSAVSNKRFLESNLIAGEVSVSNEGLSWLIDGESFWQFLSSKVHGKGVSSIVGEVDLSNLDSIVSQEVVEDEWQLSGLDKESQYFSVVIEELFLRGHSSSSKLLLQELEELLILLWWDGFAGVHEGVLWAALCLRLNLVDVCEKLSGVLVGVIDPDGPAADANIKAHSEIGWLERHLRSILLDDHLPFKESSLWGTTVYLLWLGDHN